MSLDIVKFYLHDAVYLCVISIYLYIYNDAVYLYLLTLNQTLAEGNLDYRDGHVIMNKTIGQRFVGKNEKNLLTCLLSYDLMLLLLCFTLQYNLYRYG